MKDRMMYPFEFGALRDLRNMAMNNGYLGSGVSVVGNIWHHPKNRLAKMINVHDYVGQQLSRIPHQNRINK